MTTSYTYRFERQQAEPIVPPQDQVAKILTNMEQNLERLTIDIPNIGTNDILFGFRDMLRVYQGSFGDSCARWHMP